MAKCFRQHQREHFLSNPRFSRGQRLRCFRKRLACPGPPRRAHCGQSSLVLELGGGKYLEKCPRFDENLVDEMVQERMQDSIVPLASVTPSQGKKTKKKEKKKKPTPEKVELAEEVPVEEPQSQSVSQDKVAPEREELAEEPPVEEPQSQSEPQHEVDSELDDTSALIAAMEETPDKEELKAEESKKDTYGEAVESIEQMVSESVAFDGSAEQTTEKEERQEIERRHESERRHPQENRHAR